MLNPKRMLAIATLTLSPVLAQAQSPSAERYLSVDARIAEAVEEGTDLYAYDLAGWVATELLLTHEREQIGELGIVGWTTVEISREASEGRRFLTHFIRQEPPPSLGFRIVYSVETQGGDVIAAVKAEDEEDQDPLPTELANRHLARQEALDAVAQEERCATPAPMNTVVLPGNGAPVVYILTGEASEDEIAFGRHWRFESGADRAVPLSSTCFTMSSTTTASGGAVAAVSVTEVISDIPTAIHVYKSLQHDLPVFVGTVSTNTLWRVNGRQIDLLQDNNPQPVGE